MPMIDLTGRTFHYWTVTGLSHRAPGSVLYWKCRCQCGTERAVFGGDLKRGTSVSCGCYVVEAAIARLTTHGMTGHPAYQCYMTIKERCLNANNPGFYLYGGRGITISDHWLISFQNFWEDMGPTWKKGLSIERKEVNGDYEPNNCIWATSREQGNNRRTNHIIDTPKGPMNVTMAAEEFGISRVTIFSRLRYGWSGPSLVAPVDTSKRKRSRA